MEQLPTLPGGRYQQLLFELLTLVQDEQQASQRSLLDAWHRPLADKLELGITQQFARIEAGEEAGTLVATLGEGESRFREGDLLFLHHGIPLEQPIGRRWTIEQEADDCWLLRKPGGSGDLEGYAGGVCYADPDAIDLTPYYVATLTDIAGSPAGRTRLLPLLSGDVPVEFDVRDFDDACAAARAAGCNPKQVEAVAKAFAAEQFACIQGPPGTGKTRVLALLARLMVARGERVLVTSHTHTAINNALNKIHAEGVPVVKVGRETQGAGLAPGIVRVPKLSNWSERPDDGYVVGATPFATCTPRLQSYQFDVVLFDEASQVTVPLALMAMRKGRRYVFIGDQRQLPPVLQSRSVLAKDAFSVFARLTSVAADHSVMLDETYRMSEALTAWPSTSFYQGQLRAAAGNRDRRLVLDAVPERLAEVFDPEASAVFIPTRDLATRTRNYADAECVAELCEAAVAGGLPPGEIGIVTPYRAQARAVRELLVQRFGRGVARQIVADTVERMQGQEREMIILTLATGDEVFLQVLAGFFFQPQRLNVSVTRARSKLIILGPELNSLPLVEDKTLARWVGLYRDLVRRCRRVAI